jgi:hypothetical protein
VELEEREEHNTWAKHVPTTTIRDSNMGRKRK